MALVFMDGFDASDHGVKWTSRAGGAQISASTRFGTGQSMNISGYFWNLKKTFPTAYNSVFIGFAMYVAAGGTAGSDTYISLWGDDGQTRHLRLVLNGTSSLRIVRGDGTVLASSSLGTFPTNGWNYIEISATIADAGGTCVIRVNGGVIMNFTGDTKNGGTNTSIDTIILGDSGANSGPNSTTLIDDMYVCDATGSAPYNTFLGDVRVQTLVPNGAGSSTQFTPSAGANYTDVDELPYSATDYVTSANPGDRDTYAISDLTGSPTVMGIQNNIIAKKTDSGAVSLKPAIKSGASVYYGSTAVLNSSDAHILDVRSIDPNTSTGWTASGVNALEAGFEVV